MMNHAAHTHPGTAHGKGKGKPYALLAANLVLSLVVMYLVMFSMIDTPSDFRNNLNTLYMALSMVAPMGLIMFLTMPGMFPNARWNLLVGIALAALFVLAFVGTRTQAAIGDRQFIASMVPHHSGAVLMCRQAQLFDAELVALCKDIAQGQRREIEQMNAIGRRLMAASEHR